MWAWLILLAGISHARLPVWASDLSLWQSAMEAAPTKLRPMLDLGRAREIAGDLWGAEVLYRATGAQAELDDRTPIRERTFARAAAESNLAHVYIKQRRFGSALKITDRVIARWATFPYAHYNRATILWAVGVCDDAQKSYAIARAGDPELAPPSSPCGYALQ